MYQYYPRVSAALTPIQCVGFTGILWHPPPFMSGLFQAGVFERSPYGSTPPLIKRAEALRLSPLHTPPQSPADSLL
jgi:hypothetical protein